MAGVQVKVPTQHSGPEGLNAHERLNAHGPPTRAASDTDGKGDEDVAARLLQSLTLAKGGGAHAPVPAPAHMHTHTHGPASLAPKARPISSGGGGGGGGGVVKSGREVGGGVLVSVEGLAGVAQATRGSGAGLGWCLWPLALKIDR